jgi:hypothetical protein
MKKFLGCFGLAGLMAILAACGTSNPLGNEGGGGGGGGTNGPEIHGIATKGPLNGATVTVYAVTDATGANGASLGTGTTDSSGKFDITLSSAPTGPFRVAVQGGTFLSDVDGKTSITNTATLTALVTTPSSIPNPINVTLATSLLDTMSQGYAAGLTPPTSSNKRGKHSTAAAGSSCSGGVTAGMTCALSSLGGFYGGIPSAGGSGFGGTPTVTSSSDIDAFKIGLLSGAVEVCANKAYPSNPGNFFTAIFEDASDLIFDGLNNGKPIYLDNPTGTTGKVPLSSTALTTDFLLCLNTFVNTSTVLSGSGISTTTISTTTGSIDGGVTSSPLTPKALGLSAGSSGAIASLALNGKQYLFVAARSSGVVVIDITDPTNPAPMINDWPNVATVLGADVGGVIPIIGTASHAQVVAFAYGGQTMALLNADMMISGDPTKAADESAIVDVTFKPTFNPANVNPAEVSGGSGWVLGGTPDPGRHGVWMASVDGYKLLDISLASPDFDPSNSYPGLPVTGGNAYPSPSQIAENMGADISHNLLFAGNYYGVQWVDLAGGQIYLMDSTDWATLTNIRSSYTVDGNSVDSSLQVGMLTFEDTTDIAFLNMGTATLTPGATGTPGTFTPATGGLVVLDTSVLTGNYYTFSGSAVDSTTHYGLMMAGYSTDMGVFQVQDPSSVATGSSWNGAANWSVYHLANANTQTDLGFYYEEALDPHAVGAIFNIGNSKSYGYLLDGSDLHVLQIDLAAFVSATQDATGHQPAGDPSAAGGPITAYTWTVPTPTSTKKHTHPEQHIPPAH